MDNLGIAVVHRYLWRKIDGQWSCICKTNYFKVEGKDDGQVKHIHFYA